MNHLFSHVVSAPLMRRSVSLAWGALSLIAIAVATPPAARAFEATNLPQSRVRSDAPLLELAVEAVDADVRQAENAIIALRAAGPEGFTAFRQVHAATLAKLVETPACLCALGSAEQRVAHALDRIAGQRDAASSGLYWYTDFPAAQSAAEREGKPILTLRMLGKLTDELSCANSRFFRTTLYADRETADYLSRTFVLHWQSVRPVPQITIDFGDGRKMSRTITGNSAHYVVDASGRVIDCIPGLYSPKQFRAALQDAVDVAATLTTTEQEAEKQALLASYHSAREQKATEIVSAATSTKQIPKNTFAAPKTTRRQVTAGLNTFGGGVFSNGLARGSVKLASSAQSSIRVRPERFPTAARASTLLISKSGVEVPMLRAMEIGLDDLQAAIPSLGNVAGLDVLAGTDADVFGLAEPALNELLGAEWLASVSQNIIPSELGGISLTDSTPTGGIREQVRKVNIDFNNIGGPNTSIGQIKGSSLLDGLVSPLPLANISAWKNPDAARVSNSADFGIPGEVKIDLSTALPSAEVWSQLAVAARRETEFDSRSLNLIRAKLMSIPAGGIPGEATDSAAAFKEARAATIARTIARLADDVAADTARNEFDHHRRIHARLADGRRVDADTLNEWVYAEVFLTPNADPWLGLAPDGVFSAIDAGGLSLGTEASAKTSPQAASKVSARTSGR